MKVCVPSFKVTDADWGGMLSAFMAFIEQGDEVIIFEPFFDQYDYRDTAHTHANTCRYISNIEMPGGKIVYVPMHPPKEGATKTSSAADWTIDFDELEKAITPRTKMMVLNTPRTLESRNAEGVLTGQITLWARYSRARNCSA